VQKRDNPNQYSGNQLDASNPERKRGKRKEVPKKKKNTVLKSAILEERVLRQHLKVLREQEQGDVTVHSNAHGVTNDSCLKQAVRNEAFLCDTENIPYGEVTSDNARKAEAPNSAEILDLTQCLKENLSLTTNVQAETLDQNVSDGSETTQVVQKTEIGEGNCNLALCRSPSHSCTDMLQSFSIHSRKFRE
jgi:hypothetical protein